MRNITAKRNRFIDTENKLADTDGKKEEWRSKMG